MSIDSEVRSKIEERIKEDERVRYVWIRGNIRRIISHLCVSQIELAIAIGVYAPPFGQGGNCGVNSWYHGNERPTDFHNHVLQDIASGYLRLRQTGFDQRRLIYRIFGEFCPKCGNLLHREWALEECPCSSFCDYSRRSVEDPFERVVNHGAIRALSDQHSRICASLSGDNSNVMKNASLVRCDSKVVEIWIGEKGEPKPDRGARAEILAAAILVLTNDGVECGKKTKLRVHAG